MMDLAKSLIHIEAQALVEIAYKKLDIECNNVIQESKNMGRRLYNLCEATRTKLEVDIFMDIYALFESAPMLAAGFDEEYIKQHSNDEEKTTTSLKHTVDEQLSEEIVKHATNLEKHFGVLSGVKNFYQLLLLDRGILKTLISFEECLVNRLEHQSEQIEYSTSGHHRDRLDLYLAAINDDVITNGHVYFDNNGRLNFNIVDQINLYLECFD